MKEPIRVVVADDSALMRLLVKDMLSLDKEIKVVGLARDGREAVRLVEELKPNVLTLDIKMPHLDGLEVLKKIRSIDETRVIILTGVSASDLTYEALDLGAVDFISKPSGPLSFDLRKIQVELVAKVKAAAKASLTQFKPLPEKKAEKVKTKKAVNFFKVVAVGSSTGGPPALERMVSSLKPPFPASLLVVQHLPPRFSASLARRLSRFSQLRVKEAEDGEALEADTIYVAPFGSHLTIKRSKCSPAVQIKLEEGKPVCGVIPSADRLMESVAKTFGKDAVGVLLSGMGKDGAMGMKAIKEAGGRTLVQDEKTSVVFGMAKVAVEKGYVDEILPLDKLSVRLQEIVKERKN